MSLPEDKLQQLKNTVKFRDDEFDLLNAFIDSDPEMCAPCVFVHGYRSAGKTLAVKQFLDASQVNHSYIECDSILTTGTLLQRCITSIRKDSGLSEQQLPRFYDRGRVSDTIIGCESFTSFLFNLEVLTDEGEYNDLHVLVLDGIDQFSDGSFGLMKSFDRMRDVSNISNICVVFISRQEIPSSLVTSSIPMVYFKPYTQKQIVEIFQQNQFCFFDVPELDDNVTGKQFWKSFVQVIVDSYYEFSGSNLSFLIELATQKWDSFTKQIKSGEIAPSEFLKIYRENKALLQDDSITNSTVKNFRTGQVEKFQAVISLDDLTLTSKFILIASYLASMTDSRYDIYYFTKSKFPKFKPQKRSRTEVTKKDLDANLLQGAFFDLERLYAILLVLYRNESKSFNEPERTEADHQKKQHDISKFTIASNVDLQGQLATLLSRGLIFRQVTRDILQPRTRWRCALNLDIIQSVARDIGFPLENYMA